jgi:hypothetical protein
LSSKRPFLKRGTYFRAAIRHGLAYLKRNLVVVGNSNVSNYFIMNIKHHKIGTSRLINK